MIGKHFFSDNQPQMAATIDDLKIFERALGEEEINDMMGMSLIISVLIKISFKTQCKPAIYTAIILPTVRCMVTKNNI